MNERERRERARLHAKLASVSSPSDLSKAEHEACVQEFTMLLAENECGTHKGPRFQPANLIATLHRVDREILAPMIVEKRRPRFSREGDYETRIDPDGTFHERAVVGRAVVNDIVTICREDLLRTLHGSKALFGQCPECGVIFVRVRRQKYCSANCTMKALEAARRPKKAKYMRTYRKRQKAQKGG